MISFTEVKGARSHFASDQEIGGGPVLDFNYSMGGWNPSSFVLSLIFMNPRFFALGNMVLVPTLGAKGDMELNGFQYTGFANLAVRMVRVG